jgi:regulatory protein
MDKEKSITKIEVQKKNKDRVNVFIDGDYTFSCSSELIYRHGLKVDKVINLEDLKEVVNEDNYIKCKNNALKAIEKSYKSEKEVFDKLLKNGYDEKIIARAMGFLKDYNFVNDEQYANLYIKDKIKVQGKNKIKYSLLKKGIDEQLIEEKLKEIDSILESKTALSLAEKKYRVIAKTEKDIRKICNKLWEFLMRNGYNKEIIDDALAKIINNHHEEPIEEESEQFERDIEELKKLAEKRYVVLIKIEDDKRKIYKKLMEYLFRRGFSIEDVKKVVNNIVKNEEFEE